MKRKKYFGSEQAYEFIYQNADHDGIWHGDATELAEEFDSTENDAHSALSDLCERRMIQKVYKQTFVIVNWRERDDFDSASHA
jgi:hypothetical protein